MLRSAVKTVLLTNKSFTPSALFAGGALGVWLDPSDMSSMFQDSAATTAAAIDSPVGKILDKSGNGNHAVQTTAGKRPILRFSGGLYYLEFDGTDDCLQIVSCTLPTFIYVCVGAQATNALPFFIEQTANAASNDGFWFYGSSSSTWNFHRSSAGHLAAGVVNWAGSSPMVGELAYNGTGTYWLNGTSQSNGTISGTARSDSNVTAALNLFSRNQASVFGQGRLYGLTISPVVTTSLQTQNRTAMGRKVGLIL
jgi:hypothetical protein